MTQKVGIAGTGAIGKAVAKALLNGIDGLTLGALSDLCPDREISAPYVDFDTLAESCDLIVECLPPQAVPTLARATFARNKDLTLISSCALLMFPDILENHKSSTSRIYVPSGALTGMDGIKALKELGIKKSKIVSTKPPKGLLGAPHVEKMGIDLMQIRRKERLFTGNALEAAKGFPANANVAATLSLAGIGPERTDVEVWADPEASGNTHEVTVQGEFSTIRVQVTNTPDPANPKSSMLAAQSIVATLRDINNSLVVL
jgi:aspartate dehydrogenase